MLRHQIVRQLSCNLKTRKTNLHKLGAFVSVLIFIQSFVTLPLLVSAQANVPAMIFIAKYTFDGNYENSAGSNFQGVPTDDMHTTPSPMGQAAVFNGLNDYIATGIDLAAYNQFSISVWFKESDNISRQQILAQDIEGGRIFTLEYDPRKPSGTQLYSFDGATTIEPSTSSGITIVSEQWYNAVVTHSDSVYDLYLNGELIASGSGRNYSTSAITLHIGNREYSTSPDYFKGQIDQVDLYSTILTPEYIKNEYKFLVSSSPDLSNSIYSPMRIISGDYTNTLIDLGFIFIAFVGLAFILKTRQKRKIVFSNSQSDSSKQQSYSLHQSNVQIMHNLCIKCRGNIAVEDHFCQNCGTPIISLDNREK